MTSPALSETDFIARVEKAKAAVLSGETLSRETIFSLKAAPLNALCEAAKAITEALSPRAFNFCSIINAKSGGCSEDCHWCNQSGCYNTKAPITPLVGPTTALTSAKKAENLGIPRFSLVTVGRKLNRREIKEAGDVLDFLKDNTELELCASMGLLNVEDLRHLKEHGLVRYHCNLETGPAFFPKVCTTHTFEDKVKTLKAAKSLGIELCSGGLFGMGETLEDRLEMGLVLQSLEVPSVPMNFLIPIESTPLAKQEPLPEDEVLRTIALFRLMLPKAYLRFAGGRLLFSESLAQRAMEIGINSEIVGELLTTGGTSVAQERQLAQKAGYHA